MNGLLAKDFFSFNYYTEADVYRAFGFVTIVVKVRETKRGELC